MNSGSTTVAQDIEAAVLGHVQRFRVTIPEVIPSIVGQPSFEVEQAVTTLIRRGLVFRNRMVNGIEFLVHRQRRKQISTPSKRSRIASLAAINLCHFQGMQRELLTADEFKLHFPDLYRPQHDRRYFLEHGCEAPRLGFLRIDHGSHGRWSRIIDKARRDFDRHRQDPSFADLIGNRWFEVHIVTSTKRKAIRIEQAIRQTRRRSDETIRVTAIPELLPFILSH